MSETRKKHALRRINTRVDPCFAKSGDHTLAGSRTTAASAPASSIPPMPIVSTQRVAAPILVHSDRQTSRKCSTKVVDKSRRILFTALRTLRGDELREKLLEVPLETLACLNTELLQLLPLHAVITFREVCKLAGIEVINFSFNWSVMESIVEVDDEC